MGTSVTGSTIKNKVKNKKENILRGLYWLFFLDTSGDKHISHKQTQPIVGSLIVLDDKVTGRGDKKKINRKGEVRRRERAGATEGEMEKDTQRNQGKRRGK